MGGPSSLDSVRVAAAQLRAMLASGTVASLDAVLCNADGRFDGPVTLSYSVPTMTRR